MNGESRNNLVAGVYTVAATNETEFRIACGVTWKQLEIILLII